MQGAMEQLGRVSLIRKGCLGRVFWKSPQAKYLLPPLECWRASKGGRAVSEASLEEYVQELGLCLNK